MIRNLHGANIWQLQSHGDVEGIIQALDDRDPRVRWRAITALRNMHAHESLEHLRQMRLTERHLEVFQLLNETIKAFDPDDEAPPYSQTAYLDALLSQLHGTDVEQSRLAAERLGNLGDKSVVEHLVIVFQNEQRDSEVRLAAADALLKLNSAPASASLLAALRKDDWQLRRNAAAILGQLRAEWAVTPLIMAMRHDVNLTVRKTAAAALLAIKTPRAIQAFREYQRDED